MTEDLTIRLQGVSTAPLPPVQWNQAEVQAWLDERVEIYRGRAYGPDSIKDAKKDRAAVNNLEKELAAAQKRVQDLYKQPVEAFTAEMKRLRGITKEISASIDRQVKEVEEAERQERRDALEAVYREHVGAELAELVPFALLLDAKWLNKSTSVTAARKELLARIETVRAEMENLRAVCGEDFPQIQRTYLERLDVNAAFADFRRLQEMRQAQARAQAAREAEEQARASAPIVVPPTAEEREARQAGREQAQANACVTAEGRLDFAEMAQQAAPRYHATLEITYTAGQGRALADFLRASGIEYKITTK